MWVLNPQYSCVYVYECSNNEDSGKNVKNTNNLIFTSLREPLRLRDYLETKRHRRTNFWGKKQEKIKYGSKNRKPGYPDRRYVEETYESLKTCNPKQTIKTNKKDLFQKHLIFQSKPVKKVGKRKWPMWIRLKVWGDVRLDKSTSGTQGNEL